MANQVKTPASLWRERVRFTLAATLGGWIVITLFYICGLVPTTLAPEAIVAPRPAVPELTQIDTTSNTAIVPEATVTSSSIPTGIAHNPRQPIRITIPKIGTDAPVYNPESTRVDVLDSFLTRGAVRYPGSGLPRSGNMFIFGHSSNWPVVHNQAYKTFNGIGTLEKGDEILVYTVDKAYKYVVSSVKLVDSNQAYVSFDSSDTMLTLSTCNSFGTKEERFVVEAKLISTLPN